jgi:hypothetical protein
MKCMGVGNPVRTNEATSRLAPRQRVRSEYAHKCRRLIQCPSRRPRSHCPPTLHLAAAAPKTSGAAVGTPRHRLFSLSDAAVYANIGPMCPASDTAIFACCPKTCGRTLSGTNEGFSGLALPCSRLADILLFLQRSSCTCARATKLPARPPCPACGPVVRGSAAYRQEQRVIARALQAETEWTSLSLRGRSVLQER